MHGGEREMGLRGVVRGKKIVTTNPDTARPCPDGKVNRVARADRPNRLWGEPLSAIGPRAMASDCTCVPTWPGTIHVAPRRGHPDRWRSDGSIIDVFARRIMGWRVPTSMPPQVVPNAPAAGAMAEKTAWEQELGPSRRPRIAVPVDPPNRASGRCRRRSLRRHGRRFPRQRAGRERHRPPRDRGHQATGHGPPNVAWEAMHRVNRSNTKRLHSVTGSMPPAEAELRHPEGRTGEEGAEDAANVPAPAPPRGRPARSN